MAYSPTFSREVMPAWLDFIAVLCGRTPPDPSRALRWCELGCGMGITAVTAAATHPSMDVHAIDLMPPHVAHAQSLGATADAGNVTFHCASFSDARLDALGSFDYIVAHGVYSWIDADARKDLRAFVDRHLAPGGLAYISYNAMPGWAPDLPLQRLLRELAGAQHGDSLERFAAAADLAADMTDAGARALVASPMARAGLQAFREHTDAAYFPHEYLPRGWEPRYVTDVRREFAEIGLTPVGSTIVRDNFDSYTMTARGREALDTVADADLRELLRDYFRGTSFRRDLFGRDLPELALAERRERLAAMTFQLDQPASLVSYRMRTAAGEVAFDTAAAHAIVDALAAGPSTLAALDTGRFPASDLLANALVLCAAGNIRPVAATSVDVTRINEALASVPEGTGYFPYRAAPHGTALLLDPVALDGADDDGSATARDAWSAFLEIHGIAPVARK